MLSVGAQSNYLAENTGQIYDHQKDVRYRVGRFLGKGGFARCYEVSAQPRGKMLAAKVVSRESISKKTTRSKMIQEIKIHREMTHQNVVKMLDHFTDDHNVYVILELCESQSLMELHKRRQIVSEEEARYFMGQIVDGLEYVHSQLVIHRDLKLGNLFLTGNMVVKIGDFGLATRVADENELKKGLCGTPNYTAPEMLGKKGHLYEVDIWALGCILFTLLVGKPPFETSTLQETYMRIRKNRYNIPSWISPHATHLIRQLLANQPSKRPKVNEIKLSDFFKNGYWPHALPTSCLTVRPNFNFLPTEDESHYSLATTGRRPLSGEDLIDLHSNLKRVRGRDEGRDEDYEQQYQRLNRLITNQEDNIEHSLVALQQCRKQHRSNGTLAEITAHRTLLLATERLRILRQELERLNAQQNMVNGPLLPSSPSLRGSMTISTIRIYLNRGFCLKSVDKDATYDFVVLLRSGESVYATQVATVMDLGALRGRTVRFPDTIRFNRLMVDFTIHVEIFAMKIENRTNDAKNSCITKRALQCLNPLGSRPLKSAEESAVSSFQFCRCGHIRLNKETTGTLKLYVDDAEYPLEGTIEMRADCSMLSAVVEIEYDGYLSMYELTGTESTWTRYWAVLRQGIIKFWRCSTEESSGKPAHAYIDLSKVTNDVITLSPVEICSRPHTLFIDLFTQSTSFNQRLTKPVYCLKRVLLNADTKQLCDAWMISLNETLSVLRENAKAKEIANPNARP